MIDEENLIESTENAEAAQNDNLESIAADPPVPPKEFGDKPVNERRRTVFRWIIMSAGVFMMACSVYFFQTPNNITLGGMAGAALLLHYAFPSISQGLFLNIINIVIIITGLIILGKQCTVRTIYCSFLYTGLVLGMEYLIGDSG